MDEELEEDPQRRKNGSQNDIENLMIEDNKQANKNEPPDINDDYIS